MSLAFGGERRASASREITKKFEETRRGTLAELAAWASGNEMRGELVVVVAGRPSEAPPLTTLVGEALRRVESGERAKAVVADLAATFGVAQRELYAAVVEARSAN